MHSSLGLQIHILARLGHLKLRFQTRLPAWLGHSKLRLLIQLLARRAAFESEISDPNPNLARAYTSGTPSSNPSLVGESSPSLAGAFGPGTPDSHPSLAGACEGGILNTNLSLVG
jgi:hypothetical protein